MKEFLLGVSIVFLTVANYAQALHVVKDNVNCSCGIKNSEGNWVLEPSYILIEQYNSGYFLVRDIEGVGIFTPDGKQLIPCLYDRFSVSTRNWHTNPDYYGDQSKFKIEGLAYLFGVRDQQQYIFNLQGEIIGKFSKETDFKIDTDYSIFAYDKTSKLSSYLDTSGAILIDRISIAQTELDETGFNEIRLGASFESIEKRLTIVDISDVPEYAWFASMTLDYWLQEVGQDSASYYEMLETDRLIAESLNTKIVRCTFNKKKDMNFFHYPIECAQLVFKENVLIGISLVFDQDDMTSLAKRAIVNQFEKALGDGLKNHNHGNPIPEFARKWSVDNNEVSISNLDQNGGVGLSLNAFFWQE